jgi:hypothetical protein
MEAQMAAVTRLKTAHYVYRTVTRLHITMAVNCLGDQTGIPELKIKFDEMLCSRLENQRQNDDWARRDGGAAWLSSARAFLSEGVKYRKCSRHNDATSHHDGLQALPTSSSSAVPNHVPS